MSGANRMTFTARLGGAAALAALLTGCTTSQQSADTQSVSPTSTRLVERDIEAPEVFQASEEGLWDGRPSLGGVWVAYPGIKDPERVIIRNETNGKFVIGALFRRERENPGPAVQVSSDAADALGMLAGQPVPLNITALRRDETTDPDEAPTAVLGEPEEIAESALDIPTGNDTAQDTGTQIASATLPDPAPVPDLAPAPASVTATDPAPDRASTSALQRPFIQIGIFSVEQNALNTVRKMQAAGIDSGSVRQQSLNGKGYWRVVVGPSSSEEMRSRLLGKVKSLGFTDAYAVSD
ncbi:SPOR domain-containing protein [Profundibacterium mesophilum]|uniref:Lipoprotein n=1 Tax=Profundibacterium mesophilum KAUST100406-0324 TaxID=1037889 RepID=A0A921TCU5_9RHOB|nr:SPOR domain-containing protein [Profundibacterium mesophilum]KAF0676093.1 lipoprotein [Profundibacterium mesophilum KAUST100406-0324]